MPTGRSRCDRRKPITIMCLSRLMEHNLRVRCENHFPARNRKLFMLRRYVATIIDPQIRS